MKAGKQRIDQLLYERGLAESREKARALLLAGCVLVDGQKVDKAGAAVAVDARIELLERMKWVSRGAFKMLGALERWPITVRDKVCLDVGSSTGGFTEVLLEAGARRVHCVDVGAGQLHYRLRNDPRVVVHEGVNARYMDLSLTGEPAELGVCDVSFISVTLILPALVAMLTPPREFVVLVKPQFEVGRDQVGRGGIVRDAALQQGAVDKVRLAAGKLGFTTEAAESPVLGAEGNKEFLLHGTDTHGWHHLEA